MLFSIGTLNSEFKSSTFCLVKFGLLFNDLRVCSAFDTRREKFCRFFIAVVSMKIWYLLNNSSSALTQHFVIVKHFFLTNFLIFFPPQPLRNVLNSDIVPPSGHCETIRFKGFGIGNYRTRGARAESRVCSPFRFGVSFTHVFFLFENTRVLFDVITYYFTL